MKRNDLEIKRQIFDIFENARVLFNGYYNGFDHSYDDEDAQRIKAMLDNMEYDIKELKGELYVD